MFGPWIEIFAYFKGLVPNGSSFAKPRFNFILLHYSYMICMSLICSVVLYGARNMAYIDALFFGMGAATQSGLNTINVNDLFLYQQIALMMISNVTNPIFINTFVVFVRLYWFEKRFQNIVLEAQKLRKAKERSRTKTQAKEDAEIDAMERGGHHANMAVAQSGRATIEKTEEMLASEAGNDSDGKITDASERNRNEAAKTPFHRDITFADEIRPKRDSDAATERLPEQLSAEQNIAFFERQRDQTDDETLYIPGPRDFERGQKPQKLRSEKASDDAGAEAPIVGASSEDKAESTGSAQDSHRSDRNFTGFLRSHLQHKLQTDETQATSSSFNPRNVANILSPTGLRQRGRVPTFSSFRSRGHDEDFGPMPYLSYEPTIGRNSAFVNLSEEQREELGGIEYRALKTLAKVLVAYFLGFHILGLLSYLPWIVRSGSRKDTLSSDGVNYVWWGIFTPASMFNDLGITLTPDSMSSFNNAAWPLLLGSFLIIIGNTGFPCMLRFSIWMLQQFVPRGTAVWEELRFLLDHPRRCFTLLFPSNATWWLFWVLVVLNVLDLIFFIILDVNDSVVTSLSPGTRVLDGWFQATSTRTAGFSVVNLALLHPAIQVSYLIMMYISVFPIAISVRRTNVYEEKSLGIYRAPTIPLMDKAIGGEEDTQSYVGAHLRRQLSFDLWYVFLGLFVIAIIEGSRLQDTTEFAFSLFSVLFEIVSAYGTVGLSLGYPGTDTSFSAQLHALSKLIIIAMMLRGRHRGLPYQLDKAILLPSEHLHKKENEIMTQIHTNARRASGASNAVTSATQQEPFPDVEQDAIEAHSVQDVKSESGRSEGGKSRSTTGGLSRLISSAISAGPSVGKRRD